MNRTQPDLLPKRPPLTNAEAFVSFLPRLAWSNGFETASQLCSILGIARTSSNHFSPSMIDRIARLSGVAAEDLQRFSIPAGSVIKFGSSVVKRSQLQTTGLRYCPVCLADDGQRSEMYTRGIWQWRMIAHCPTHGCRLHIDKRGPFDLTSFKPFAKADVAKADTTIDSDTYFANRLVDPSDSGYLDQFPAYVAAEFCTLVGHFKNSLDTSSSKSRIPDGYENADLREKGFQIARNGESAVADLLSAYVSENGKRVKVPLDLYSPALGWAAVNKYEDAYTPLLRVFQKHAEDSIPLEPGSTFIWPITTRKVFTLASASREYGLSEARIKRSLENSFATGQVPRFIKREDCHAVLLEAASYVTTSEAAIAMGCTMAVCDDFIKAGVISVKANRDYNGRVFRLVHKKEIENLLSRFRNLVSSSELQGLAPINSVRRATRVSFVQIIMLALAGKLIRISATGKTANIETLRFDAAEVASAQQAERERGGSAVGDFDPEIIDIDAARRRLGVKKSTIEQMIEDEVIAKFSLAGPAGKRVGVKKEEIDAFGTDHVSARYLADQHGVTVQEVVRDLTKLAVMPRLKSRFSAFHFYQKSDVKAVGFL